MDGRTAKRDERRRVEMDEGMDHRSIGQQRSKQRNRYETEKEKTK